MRPHTKTYTVSIPAVAGLMMAMLAGMTLPASAETGSSRATSKRTISPSAVFQELHEFENAIGERGVLLKGENVWMMAPATRSRQAEMILPYMAKGYDVMHDIVGCACRTYHHDLRASKIAPRIFWRYQRLRHDLCRYEISV